MIYIEWLIYYSNLAVKIRFPLGHSNLKQNVKSAQKLYIYKKKKLCEILV